MKFIYYFAGRWIPINPELMSGKAYCRLAVAAEKAGFHGACLDEHPAPVSAWLATPGGHHCFDPFVGLAGIATVTSRLRLLTYLAVLPYRNPFMLAKAATSLDVMSDGRLILGAGVGYMKGEFEALGVEFEKRNELFTEALDVFKRACSGEPVTHRGFSFVADRVVIQPAAVQKPHPPIWLGGNSRVTRRRVAEYAQGWLPMPQKRNSATHKTPPCENLDDLRQLLGELREYADQFGRKDPLEVVVSSAMLDSRASFSGWVEQIKAMEDIGVSGVTVNGTGKSLA